MPSTQYESIRNLTDVQAVERARTDFVRSGRTRRIDQNRRYEKIYQALDPPLIKDTQQVDIQRRKGRSNNFLPIGAMLVDTAVAQLYQSLFGIPRYFKVNIPDEEDYLFQEVITQHMLNRHKEMKFKHRCFDAIQTACCFDYAVSFMRWDLQWGFEPKRVVTQKRVAGGLDQKVIIEQRWVPDAIDRPTIETLNFFSCYPDPDAKIGFEDSQFFGDKRRDPFQDLKRQERSKKQPHGKYKNINKILEAINDIDVVVDGTTVGDEATFSGRIPIHRYWTFDQILEYVPVGETTNGIVIRRVDTSGWVPKLWKLFKKPGSFEGMGLLQRLERIQLDINASANAARDFQNLISDPIAVASLDLVELEEGDIELDRKVYTVGGGEARDKLQFVMPGIDITGATSSHITFMQNFARQVAPVGGENAGGSFMTGRRSATEVAEVGAGTDTKKFLIADLWTESTVGPLLLDQFKLEQQNMTKADALIYMGPQGQEFPMDVDPAIYKTNAMPMFSMEGPTYMMYEESRKAGFVNASQLAFQVDPNGVDRQEWMKILWTMFAPEDAYRLIADPNKYPNVPAPQENFMIASGRPVEISPLNDHAEHIAMHNAVKNTADYQFWPDAIKAILEQHILEHQQAASQAIAGAVRAPEGFQDQADQLRGRVA